MYLFVWILMIVTLHIGVF